MDCADRIIAMKPSEPLIVCPTHGRAGHIRVLEMIPDIPLCVSKSQLPLYKEHYPHAEYIVHPDELLGIAPKRQWLVDRHPEVFMFDDDVRYVLDLGVGAGEGDARIRDPQAIRDLVQRLFDIAKVVGAHIVGFSSYGDPATYRPHAPFAFTGFCSGHALGIRRDERFRLPSPSSWLLTDDLYLSALAHFYDRKVVRNEAIGVKAGKTWKATGGMSTYRTTEGMRANEKMLVQLFGDAIVRRGETARAKQQVEIQLTLKVPW